MASAETAPAAETPSGDPLAPFHATIEALVRSAAPDLTQRQLAVLLRVHSGPGPHTVRGMAAALNVSKPAITRALDRLGDLDLTRRKVDPMDRRSVLVLPTDEGARMVAEMRALMAGAAPGGAS